MSIRRRSIATLLAALLATHPVAMAGAEQPPAPDNGTRITLNFKDAPIREVAETIGDITGRTFIIDPRVKGRVTVTTPGNQRISPEAAYAAFLSILEVHGFAAVPSDGLVKIIPAVEGTRHPGIQGADGEGYPDDFVTRIITLEHIPAAQLVPTLRNLTNQYAHLAAFAPANALIVSARVGNVGRLLRIIERIDQPADDEVEVIRLEHASAAEVVRVLTSLNQGGGRQEQQPGSLSIVADERTNSILLGGSDSQRVRMRAIISHLDTPLEQGGNTQVVYLRYADAEKLAELLKGYVSEQEQGAEGQSAGPSAGKVSIIPAKGTNALVLTAPPKEMRSVKSVIEKLDIRRAQVLVEAIIVEITSDKSAELGVTWAAADESGSNQPVGLTNFSGSGPGIAQIAAGLLGDDQNTSAVLSAVPDGLNLGFGNLDSGNLTFAALVRALAGDSATNILSTPSLVTMDNEEAEIHVGQEVPFVTGQFTTNTGGGSGRGGLVGNPFQTVQRKEVGITLKLTPRINSEGDSVFLDIEQEVSSLSGSSTGTDVITNKREIKTRVIAQDGQIVVLGGLIDDQLTETEQRVPLLGSIPLLGNLFKYQSTSKKKRNLMVFLRPEVLRSPEDATYFTHNKYRQIRDIQGGKDPEDVELLWRERRPMLAPLKELMEGRGASIHDKHPDPSGQDDQDDG